MKRKRNGDFDSKMADFGKKSKDPKDEQDFKTHSSLGGFKFVPLSTPCDHMVEQALALREPSAVFNNETEAHLINLIFGKAEGWIKKQDDALLLDFIQLDLSWYTEEGPNQPSEQKKLSVFGFTDKKEKGYFPLGKSDLKEKMDTFYKETEGLGLQPRVNKSAELIEIPYVDYQNDYVSIAVLHPDISGKATLNCLFYIVSEYYSDIYTQGKKYIEEVIRIVQHNLIFKYLLFSREISLEFIKEGMLSSNLQQLMYAVVNTSIKTITTSLVPTSLPSSVIVPGSFWEQTQSPSSSLGSASSFASSSSSSSSSSVSLTSSPS